MQEVTNGRFILGVGSQTKGQVRTQVGIDPESPAKMARDMVLAIQSLMNGEGHYEGEYYKLNTGPRLVIHATGKKPPPIYFSGVNALMLGLSGELCDGMLAHPIFSKKDFEDVVWPLVDKGLKKSNKQRDDFKMCALPMIWVLGEGTDRAEAYSRGKRNLANYFSTKAYSGYMDSHGWSKEKDQIREVWLDAMKSGKPIDGDMMEDILSEDIVDEVCIIGDPQEVREKVIERYDGLADSLYFYAFHDSFPTRSEEEEGIKVEQNLLRVIDAFKEICLEQGVEFHTNEAVQSVNIEEKTIQSIVTDKRTFETDIVVGSADYNHVDSKLLPPKYRNYNDSYWQKKTFSPSFC